MQNTEVVTYQPRWFQNQLMVPGVVALAGMFWLAESGNLGEISGPLFLVLLAQIILFLLLVRRPIWAMAALVVGQCTASNYMLSIAGLQISVRFLWAIMTLLLLVPILRKKGGIKLGSKAQRIIIPAIILFCVATIANFVNTDLSSTVTYLRMIVTSLIILFLLPASIKNEGDLKLLALVALITCSVSAIFALLQYLSLQGILPIYELYEGTIFEGRVSGLSESPVALGFILPIVLLPMIALYLLKGVNSRTRNLLLLLSAIILTALFFTFTRSGIYSLIPAFLFMAFLMKDKLKNKFFLVMLIMSATFFLFAGMTNSRYFQGFSDEGSAAGRLVLWQVGVDIALDHPILGIGVDRYLEVSPKYLLTIDPSLIKVPGAERVLGNYRAHDDFLTVWLSFGTAALLAYLWIFIGILHNFLEAYRHSSTLFLKGFTLGCLGAVAAYIVNAATHNVMDSSMLIWILGGLSIATTKIALSKSVPQVKKPNERS